MQFSKEEYDVIIEALNNLPNKDILSIKLSTMEKAIRTTKKEEIEEIFHKATKEMECAKLASIQLEILCKNLMLRFLSLKSSIVVDEQK